MFTGIIKELGKLTRIKGNSTGLEIEVTCNNLAKDLQKGDSIAVNGCCLTVKENSKKAFISDISNTTLSRTTFKYLKSGEIVNLENSLTLKDGLGGHLLTGHIDDTGKIVKIERRGEFYQFYIKIKTELLPYIIPRGSIALDGISLTVSGVGTETAENESGWENLGKDVFHVSIIPFTFENTNLKFKKEGDLVNIEVDLILRYLVNILKNYAFIENTTDFSSPIETGNLGDFPGFPHFNERKKEWKEKDKLLKEMLEKYGFTK
ncbi:MAG: riboflavin synthase [Actinobacteria bacterium]|nr:riboflavin synthase [Actinomycetota bacterium]